MEDQYILLGSDGKLSLFQLHSETNFGAWQNLSADASVISTMFVYVTSVVHHFSCSGTV